MKRMFSEEWFREYCRRISLDKRFRSNGAGWRWNVVFVVVGDPASRSLRPGMKVAVRMKLRDGRCEGVETVGSEGASTEEYVISGDASVWEAIVEGKSNIVDTILRGKLKVTGDIRTLMRYIPAAEDLARIAGEVV